MSLSYLGPLLIVLVGVIYSLLPVLQKLIARMRTSPPDDPVPYIGGSDDPPPDGAVEYIEAIRDTLTNEDPAFVLECLLAGMSKYRALEEAYAK